MRGSKTCMRCGLVKPREEFLGRRKICAPCSQCPICDNELPIGRRTCSDACLHELRQRNSSTATRTTPDGTIEKRCHACRKWKVRGSGFYAQKRDPMGVVTEWASKCKSCQVTYTTAINRRKRADPERGPELRRRQREANRRWRKQHPGRANEIVRAYRRRVYSDPQKRALRREAARMTRRLRLEREGVRPGQVYGVRGYTMRYRKGPVYDAHPELRVPHPEGGECVEVERGPSRRKRMRPRTMKATPPDQFSRLPALPLAEALMRQAEIGDLALDAFCNSIGIPSRTLLRWRSQSDAVVQFNLADKLLQHLGLHWWEVWDPKDSPEVAERLAA